MEAITPTVAGHVTHIRSRDQPGVAHHPTLRQYEFTVFNTGWSRINTPSSQGTSLEKRAYFRDTPVNPAQKTVHFFCTTCTQNNMFFWAGSTINTTAYSGRLLQRDTNEIRVWNFLALNH